MRIDPLQQYAKLRQQVMAEKASLEARLAAINQVLGSETTAPVTATATTMAATAAETEVPAPIAPPKRRGRRPKNKLSMREAITQALSERGPLTRKELGQAVIELGYKSKAKNPLGSVGNLLYGKTAAFKNKGGKFYLPGSTPVQSTESNGNGEAQAQRKHKRSPEVRARMAKAQKASWAKRKRGK